MFNFSCKQELEWEERASLGWILRKLQSPSSRLGHRKGTVSLAGLCTTSRSSPSTQELKQLMGRSRGGKGLSASRSSSPGTGQAPELGAGRPFQLAKLPGTPPTTDCISPEVGKTLCCHRKKNKGAGSVAGATQQTPSGSASGWTLPPLSLG